MLLSKNLGGWWGG